jgi:hypothetical protein
MRVLIIVALLAIQGVSAQNFKFGKVSKKELIDTTYEKDTTANAVVLYKSQKIKFMYSDDLGFTKRNEVHERIKIYNKEGFNWATRKVRLYDRSASKREKLVGLNAYTYRLENGKVVKTKLKKESIFEEKNNKYLATKSFTMPNVSEGCIIEFQYKIDSPYAQIEDVILQYNIPIEKLEISIKTPEYFNYKKQMNLKARFFPDIEETKTQNTVTSSNIQRKSTKYSTTSNSEYTNWSYDINVMKIEENNIPALKTEPFVSNLDNHRSKLILEYAYFKGPDEIIKNYATTWESVAETIAKSSGFGGQLEKKNYFEDEVGALISGIEDPTEKINLIYSFVKDRMTWNGNFGFESRNGVKQAYKNRKGNVGDINLMLTAILRHVGINANPVLTSTRANGIPVTPTITGFNYVITAVDLDNKLLLLDATNTITAPGTLPLRTVNWQGRMIKPNGTSTWIDLSPKVFSRENVLLDAEITEGLTVVGKVRKRLTHYSAYNFRRENTTLEDDDLIRNMEEGKGEIEISGLDIKNLKTLNKPVSYGYNYTLENEVEEIGDKLYISPLLFLASKENIFKQSERAYPIDFIYPTVSKCLINLKVPEGYAIESLPESIKLNFNENEGDFSLLVKEVNGNIQISINNNLKTTYIIPEHYEQFKSFTDGIVEKENEKIVLKKL